MMTNKKGISPLIATVLVIGFTILLAALVITWGTNLFKDTVADTQVNSDFSIACTTGLKLEAERLQAAPAGVTQIPNGLYLRLRLSIFPNPRY